MGNLIADGSNNDNEPLQQHVPDLQRDPNWLVANEKVFAPVPQIRFQTPGRRRLRLKRVRLRAKGERARAPYPKRPASSPKRKTDWTDTKKRDECGSTQNSLCMARIAREPRAVWCSYWACANFCLSPPGFPRVESYALWLENIRPSK